MNKILEKLRSKKIYKVRVKLRVFKQVEVVKLAIEAKSRRQARIFAQNHMNQNILTEVLSIKKTKK